MSFYMVSPFRMSRGPVWPPKGMAIRGHVSGRGPAMLGRMSASEPFGDHTGPRRCLYMDIADLRRRPRNICKHPIKDNLYY